VAAYARGQQQLAAELPSSLFEQERQLRQSQADELMRRTGPENPYLLHKELGEWMTRNVTVIRYNARLRETDAKLQELLERYQRVQVPDRRTVANQSLFFTRALLGMLELARVITLGALRRDESRGAHYKPEFPDRNDPDWLKTTLATYTPDGPHFAYESVDTSYIPPRPRRYDVDAGSVRAAAATLSAVAAGNH
jgi:succinate dehydrogenase / fumarate reductase flavoprotein subunit